MKNKSIYILIVIFSISPLFLCSTNPISQEAFNEIHFAKEDISSGGLWSKTKVWIVKKWMKIGKKDALNSLSNLSLILGIASLALLIVLLISSFALEILLTVIIIAALLGIILSLVVLQKTKKDKTSNRKERKKAWWGLVLNSITTLSLLGILGIIIFILLTFF